MSVGGKGPQAQINITPMIDVLLVLIIIFMVITPVAPRGLNALVPQAPAGVVAPVAPAHDIVISVRKDGISLNQEPVDLAALENRLVRLYKNGGTQPVFVRGEKDLEFRQVAEVIDAADSAGVGRIAFMPW
jgi:biopolymer transport protein ExbD